jgi:hypothetical protein
VVGASILILLILATLIVSTITTIWPLCHVFQRCLLERIVDHAVGPTIWRWGWGLCHGLWGRLQGLDDHSARYSILLHRPFTRQGVSSNVEADQTKFSKANGL